MYQRYLDFPSYVKGGTVEPPWMADGNSFWYVEGDPEEAVIRAALPSEEELRAVRLQAGFRTGARRATRWLG